MKPNPDYSKGIRYAPHPTSQDLT